VSTTVDVDAGIRAREKELLEQLRAAVGVDDVMHARQRIINARMLDFQEMVRIDNRREKPTVNAGNREALRVRTMAGFPMIVAHVAGKV
jgi:hypothetical protein